MRFFDKLLSNFGGGDTGPPCPTCGGALDNEELVEGSYWCKRCGLLLKEYCGELVDVKSLREGGSQDDWRGSDLDHCPYCGTPLTGFECWKCTIEFGRTIEFVYEAEADKLVERGLSSLGERPERSERRCIGCDLPLKHSSVLTPAWADADNRDAYITCADCGCRENIVES